MNGRFYIAHRPLPHHREQIRGLVYFSKPACLLLRRGHFRTGRKKPAAQLCGGLFERFEGVSDAQRADQSSSSAPVYS